MFIKLKVKRGRGKKKRKKEKKEGHVTPPPDKARRVSEKYC